MDVLRWVGAFLAVLAVGYLVFEWFQAARERRAARVRERQRERQRADAVDRISAQLEDAIEDTAPAVLSPPEFSMELRGKKKA
jgi:hypothetical protein